MMPVPAKWSSTKSIKSKSQNSVSMCSPKKSGGGGRVHLRVVPGGPKRGPVKFVSAPRHCLGSGKMLTVRKTKKVVQATPYERRGKVTYGAPAHLPDPGPLH